MKIDRIGERTIVFSFQELEVNLLAIYGDKYTYLCDTYLGPEPMEKVKAVFMEDDRVQPIIIFNSHWDWDHVWGNCAFPDSRIFSHQKCRENLEVGFWSELERNKHYIRGDVKPLFPNMLFSDRVIFAEDDVEFQYTPGHTNDSASCYDRKDDILYAGDNIEYPFPYVSSPDVETYIQTLKRYLLMKPKHIIAGHGEEVTDELILSNIHYLEHLIKDEEIVGIEWDESLKKRHQLNRETIRNRKVIE